MGELSRDSHDVKEVARVEPIGEAAAHGFQVHGSRSAKGVEPEWGEYEQTAATVCRVGVTANQLSRFHPAGLTREPASRPPHLLRLGMQCARHLRRFDQGAEYFVVGLRET